MIQIDEIKKVSLTFRKVHHTYLMTKRMLFLTAAILLSCGFSMKAKSFRHPALSQDDRAHFERSD